MIEWIAEQIIAHYTYLETHPGQIFILFWIVGAVTAVAGSGTLLVATWMDVYEDRKRQKIDKKVDAFFADFAARKKLRAPSSTCVEHLALNQKVPGSNPGGLTNEEAFRIGASVKRRITWYLGNRTAVAMSPGDALPTKFQWRDLPRPERLVPGFENNKNVRQCRDFRPDEKKVQLIWDGMNMEDFLDSTVLKIFIIRMVYDIADGVLIPSELLREAGLVYGTGDWVDEWGCTDKNDEIVECARDIFPPKDRKIQLMDFGGRDHRIVTPAKPRIHAKIDNRRFMPKTVDIPDHKCFYTFSAGGFYEKDQDPLEKSCQKGKTAV